MRQPVFLRASFEVAGYRVDVAVLLVGASSPERGTLHTAVDRARLPSLAIKSGIQDWVFQRVFCRIRLQLVVLLKTVWQRSSKHQSLRIKGSLSLSSAKTITMFGVKVIRLYSTSINDTAMVNFTFNELSTSTKPCIALYARYRLYQRQIQNIEVMKT